MEMKNLWMIISGPSGSGQTTMAGVLMAEFPSAGKVLTCTTRDPGPGEQDGVHYRFFSDSEFKRLLRNGAFLEHMPNHGYLYGTLLSDLRAARERYHPLISVMDPEGTLKLKERYPEVLTVFITAPSIDVLRRRLEARVRDDPKAIERRLAKAPEDLALAPKFDLVIMNDDLDRAKEVLIRHTAVAMVRGGRS